MGINYRIVKYFLDNKQLTIMSVLLVLFGGLFAFNNLRTEGFPPVPIPIAIVSTVLPGAGPETIEEVITSPLEQAISDIKGVKESNSRSENNISLIFLILEDGIDTNVVIQDINAEIETVQLPDNATDPNVFVPDIGGAPFIIAITGDLPIEDVFDRSDNLADEILEVKDISSVNRIRGIENKIYIELQSQFRTPAIIDQIKAANIAFPLGSTHIDGIDVPIAGKSDISDVDDIRAISISTTDFFGGIRVRRLDSIANVYSALDFGTNVHRVGFLDDNTFKIQGAVLFEVRADLDADILELDARFKEKLQEIEEREGDIDIVIVFSQAEDSQRQIDEIKAGAFGSKWNVDGPLANLGYLFGGVWLLTLAMLLFLDWRSALISLFTIPLSFLFTFIVLNLLGVQLNTIVLFSLVLVLGLVVDPAIVVLESIKRYTELGFDGKDAALRAVTAIGRGLFIAVLTSFVVFVPFGIVGGTFGAIIKFIPITVIPALFASYFVPMLFLTWLGVKFLKPRHFESGPVDEDDTTQLWGIARGFIRMNRYILDHLWLQISIIILGIAAPLVIAGALFSSGAVKQVQFSQPDDVPFISISAPLKVNSTNADRLEVAREMENVIKLHAHEFESFFYGSLDGSGGSDTLDIVGVLTQPGERDRKSGVITDSIQEMLVAKFGDLARSEELGSGPPQPIYPISVEIFGNDDVLLENASRLIAQELETYKEVIAVKYDGEDTTTELKVKLDDFAVASRGLTPPAVYGQVAAVLGEDTIFELGGDIDVVVRLSLNDKPSSVRDLEDILIFSSTGSVRLGAIASVVNEEVPSAIGKVNGERFVQVEGRVDDVKDIIAVQRRIDDWAVASASYLGLAETDLEDRRGGDEFEESFRQLFAAIAFSIIITYVIFALFFKSFLQPFIILFAIPLIFVGAFPALVVFARGQFGFLETLGIIVLIGVVENVAIFLIDFANQHMDSGMDKKDAIALSSGIRLRPIVLTQLTSMAGLLPLAVFSPFWRGLAVVVIAGIITSGILSLFTTPILYSWLTRKKNKSTPGDRELSFDFGKNDFLEVEKWDQNYSDPYAT